MNNYKNLFRVAAAIACASYLLLLSSASAKAETGSEPLIEQVKAAYLYKFANYVEWPDSAFQSVMSPIVIGISESDFTADELERVTAGRSIGKRHIEIKRLSNTDLLDGIHILFIGKRTDPRTTAKYLNAHTFPILSVLDLDNPSSQSVIKFVLDDNRLRFDVSLAVARQNGIRLNAPLLTVARHVE